MRVSVAVVCICSADHLKLCLAGLQAQQGAPEFDIVVTCDPHIDGLDIVATSFPGARLVINEGQRTPLELASLAMKEASGELILLTEDHCIPQPNWVRTMVAAQQDGRAVVGGRVEISPQATATDWAFYFVDFFRYSAPVTDGPSPTITVCNASYKRDEVAEIRDLWQVYFHETVINEALRTRFGTLWLHADSTVMMDRQVTLRDAIYERYAFGRLFGCTRIRYCSRLRRVYYALLSPVLPVLLLGRMSVTAMSSPSLARSFLRSLFPLTLMVLWWSWGEWLGYLTGRRPNSLVAAPDIRTSQRRSS